MNDVYLMRMLSFVVALCSNHCVVYVVPLSSSLVQSKKLAMKAGWHRPWGLARVRPKQGMSDRLHREGSVFLVRKWNCRAKACGSFAQDGMRRDLCTSEKPAGTQFA